jgi:hypothetical protein
VTRRADADLIACVREWIIERAGVAPDVWAPIEADLRREFGGRDHYVRRRSKAERLQRLADLPPDASAQARCAATDLSASRMYELWALLDR